MTEWYALVWGDTVGDTEGGWLLARMEETHVFAAGRLAAGGRRQAGRSW